MSIERVNGSSATSSKSFATDSAGGSHVLLVDTWVSTAVADSFDGFLGLGGEKVRAAESGALSGRASALWGQNELS